MERLIHFGLIIVVVMLAASRCRPEDEHICEAYCDEMVECAETLDQPESRSRCERECFEDLDQYETAACEKRYLELVECQKDISCNEAYDVGDKCANEIEDLVQCVK